MITIAGINDVKINSVLMKLFFSSSFIFEKLLLLKTLSELISII